MSQYEFYTLADQKPVDEWPQWAVIAECGSAYFFKKEEARAHLAKCKEAGIKAEMAKLLFE